MLARLQQISNELDSLARRLDVMTCARDHNVLLEDEVCDHCGLEA